MVARHYFRLIFFFLFFLLLSLSIKSESNMENYEINLNEAIKLYNNKELKIIDIRTINEWQMTGVVPDSFLINMHNENYSESTDFVKRIKSVLDQNKNSKIAFICASGARSELVTEYFLNQSYKDIFHIPEGIIGKEKNGWLYLGFPLKEFKKKD